jgi:hypothetical protein
MWTVLCVIISEVLRTDGRTDGGVLAACIQLHRPATSWETLYDQVESQGTVTVIDVDILNHCQGSKSKHELKSRHIISVETA